MKDKTTKIQGQAVIFSKTWMDDDDGKEYTCYVCESGNVYIEVDGELQEWTCGKKRSKEEIEAFNKEIIEFLEK